MTKQKNTRIPAFTSVEEEAAFWDTHSLADYWDESKPVEVKFAKNLSEGITIRFDRPTLIERGCWNACASSRHPPNSHSPDASRRSG